MQLNGTTGLCTTKLDVLDGLPVVPLCTGYRFDGDFDRNFEALTAVQLAFARTIRVIGRCSVSSSGTGLRNR